MRERLFYKSLTEDLTKRGFFIVTDHAPENCIGISGINGREELVRFAGNLIKEYRLAAIKNFIISVGQEECAGGFYEILVGSQHNYPYPMIIVTLQYNERYYRLALACDYWNDICRLVADSRQEEDGTRYIVEQIRYITGRLMHLVTEWIMEGKFPEHEFGEGNEELEEVFEGY